MLIDENAAVNLGARASCLQAWLAAPTGYNRQIFQIGHGYVKKKNLF
jgi:hypothetical protein